MNEEIVKGYGKLPLVTIVTVVYNGENDIEKTIQSVINQTYPNIEYIIIDGGSTDGTLDIIKKYEDKISYWVSEKDNGIYDAMNKALKVASGEWINFMNVGDYFIDNKVISNLCLDKEKADIVYGNILTSRGKIEQSKFKYKFNFLKSTIVHQSMFIKRKIHKPFNLDYKISADYDLIVNFLKENKVFKYKNIDVAYYDVNKDYMDYNRRMKYNILRVKEKMKIAKKFKFPFNLISMSYYFIKFIQFNFNLKFFKDKE